MDTFEIMNRLYLIKRLEGETDDYYYEKGNYIIKKLPNNEIELKKSYLEALKECNKKYLLCDYK